MCENLNMKCAGISVLFFLLLNSITGYSVNLPEVLTNTIYTDQIKTVQMYREGMSLTNPVISLNSEEKFQFTFDDLSNELRNYYYTIYHCDRNWKLSRIPQEEYLSNFLDFPLTDYAYSQNTKVKYINYLLTLPNEDVSIMYSGNYALVIFDKDNPDEPLITWRFYVVEQRINIDARIKRATFEKDGIQSQEVDLKIYHDNFQVNNPMTDLKVVVTQNNRIDNLITNLSPNFTGEGVYEYDFNSQIYFPGDNEYRYFEFRGNNFPGEGVTDIGYYPPLYHVTLNPATPRILKDYTFVREINGLYRIEMYNSDYPETQADYMMVHFTLELDQVLSGGGVYVFGALSNWECNKLNEMHYDLDKKQYELTMLLKQGYYNYCYAWKDFGDNKIKIYSLEGSHYQTENDYYIYVYYGMRTDRYDRLIGYKKFNSMKDRSYSVHE